MSRSRLLALPCAAAVALLSFAARADYTGFFAIPDNGGVAYTANSNPANLSVPVGAWSLSSTGIGEATLSRTPASGGVATTVALATVGGAGAREGVFIVTNTDPSLATYSLDWAYVTSTFDAAGDRLERYDNGVFTPLVSGAGLHFGGGTTILLPGQSFGWRLTQHAGDGTGEAVGLSMGSIQQVPEPSAVVLALLGLSGCGLLRRRRS